MKLIVKVEGMHCNGCKVSLERELKNHKYVLDAKVNLEEQTAYIEGTDKLNNNHIKKIIKSAGFKCLDIQEEK